MDVVIVLLIILAIVLGIPIWLYYRQPAEYRQKQEVGLVALGGRKMTRTSAISIVFSGITILLLLIQSLNQNQEVSTGDLYFTIATTIIVIAVSRIFGKKDLPHHKETINLIIIFSVIFLIIQTVLFFFGPHDLNTNTTSVEEKITNACVQQDISKNSTDLMRDIVTQFENFLIKYDRTGVSSCLSISFKDNLLGEKRLLYPNFEIVAVTQWAPEKFKATVEEQGLEFHEGIGGGSYSEKTIHTDVYLERFDNRWLITRYGIYR